MVTVVFPAAGQARRMAAGKNKVLLALEGNLILLHTLLKFSRSVMVDDLIVVVAKDEVAEVSELLGETDGLKPWKVVAGGSERQYSIANGLRVLDPRCEVVLVHDAARPLVSVAVIESVIKAARADGAAIAAVPEKNTIKVVDGDGAVLKTPPRQTLWSVQTPQGFTREILLRAYQQAEEDSFLGTDDSSLVERMGVTVKVVESDYRNIKITTPEDLKIAEIFLHTQ